VCVHLRERKIRKKRDCLGSFCVGLDPDQGDDQHD
jgi:hypothetical protein